MASIIKVDSLQEKTSGNGIVLENHLLPTDAFIDLGSINNSFRNVYTQDLVLSNENSETPNDVDGTRGSWVIQEGETDLFIINSKNGKKYKFVLQEI